MVMISRDVFKDEEACVYSLRLSMNGSPMTEAGSEAAKCTGKRIFFLKCQQQLGLRMVKEILSMLREKKKTEDKTTFSPQPNLIRGFLFQCTSILHT